MPQSALVRWFCRVYLVMLYAYPREFRLQFGGEMQQVFRDRCRHLARTPAACAGCASPSGAPLTGCQHNSGKNHASTPSDFSGMLPPSRPGGAHRLVRGTTHATARLRGRVDQ